MPRFIRVVEILVLLAGTLAVYGNTLDVPFYLDDFKTILENPAVRDPADFGALWNYDPMRVFGMWTFAVNFSLFGTDVTGYHLFNLLIHALSGIAVFFLLHALIRSPSVGGAWTPGLGFLPLACALLFLLHPLQTQAVTYIVQRLASLTAGLYLGSLAFYAWGRLKHSYMLYFFALMCTLLAFFTKQNAATLPVAIILIEMVFFRQLGGRQRVLVAIVSALGVAGVAALLNIGVLDRLTQETTDISRLDYLATQLRVLWYYVGTFYFPEGLRLEYDFPPVHGLTDGASLVALAAHLVVITGALLAWRRFPLLAFGILFYYLAHTVESGFIPIRDLVFEHRTYLPNLGLALATASVGIRLFSINIHTRSIGLVLFCGVMIVAGWLTAERNRMWRDPIAFLKHETVLTPNKERVWTSYGKELMRRGMFKEALGAFGNALNLGRTGDELQVSPTTLLNTVLALHHTGQHRKAFAMEKMLPVDSLGALDLSVLYAVRGMGFFRLGYAASAKQDFENSLRYSRNADALSGLALVSLRKKEAATARSYAMEALELQPGHPLAKKVLDATGVD